MASYCKEVGAQLRFIEYMDGGSYQPWDVSKVVPSQEILTLLRQHYEIEVMEAKYIGEVAKRYRYADSSLELGFISSVTEPFAETAIVQVSLMAKCSYVYLHKRVIL